MRNSGKLYNKFFTRNVVFKSDGFTIDINIAKETANKNISINIRITACLFIIMLSFDIIHPV